MASKGGEPAGALLSVGFQHLLFMPRDEDPPGDPERCLPPQAPSPSHLRVGTSQACLCPLQPSLWEDY